MTALYHEPWFTDLAHLTDGRGYAVYAASRTRADERGGVLPVSDLHLIFGPLSVRARQDVQQALLALRLWSEVDGGFGVHDPGASLRTVVALAPVATSTPSPTTAPTIVASERERVQQRRESDRRRQQRCRQQKRGGSSPREGVAGERDRHTDETPVTSSVTVPVTLRSPVEEEDFSLFSFFLFNQRRGRGELRRARVRDGHTLRSLAGPGERLGAVPWPHRPHRDVGAAHADVRAVAAPA